MIVFSSGGFVATSRTQTFDPFVTTFLQLVFPMCASKASPMASRDLSELAVAAESDAIHRHGLHCFGGRHVVPGTSGRCPAELRQGLRRLRASGLMVPRAKESASLFITRGSNTQPRPVGVGGRVARNRLQPAATGRNLISTYGKFMSTMKNSRFACNRVGNRCIQRMERTGMDRRCRKAAQGTWVAEKRRTPTGAGAQPLHSPNPEVA